ncbi:MAG TPA: hypothetical protein VF033_12315, partial [Steroidobacteraceae bacterium]
KLLVSVIVTILLVALPVGLLTPLAYVAGMSAGLGDLLETPRLLEYTLGLALITYTSACLAAAWLHVFIWFVTRERNSAGFAKAMLVLLVLVYAPSRADDAGGLLRSNLLHLGVFLLVFSAGFLSWPRLKQWYLERLRPASGVATPSREFAGREIDMILGNSRPWILIAVLSLPLAVTFRTSEGSSLFWVFYLTIASIVAGGNAERAPGRSRTLWLRSDYSRSTLFGVVERSSWRHNGVVMISLLLFLLAASSYSKMPAAQLIAGILLIVFGTTLTTYLGLCLTRGIRVLDTFVGVFVSAALMVGAVLVANGRGGWIVAALLATLVVLSLTLRSIARRRWARIDWTECRGETMRPQRV